MEHVSTNLEFVADYKQSKMYSDFDDHDIYTISKQNMTYNAH